MKLQIYPEYKDSGVPWLGKIPAHWELHRGKWLFQKMERPVRPQDEVVTCFRDGTVTLRKLRRISGFTESLKEIGYQGIRKGDLIIHQMDAFAGAVGVSDSDGKGTPVYSVCLPKRDLDTHYYAQLVREMSRSDFITSLAKGIRERSTDFRFDTFASLLLPVPLPDEQRTIARFMRNESAQINKFIRNKRRLIELLKEQKQNVINQAVTRGIYPDVKLKPSGVEWIGDIPEHWAVAPLKHLASINSRVLPESTDENYTFKYFDISSVGTGRLTGEPETIRFGKAPSRARRILQKGDTILSTVRTYLKAVYYVSGDVEDWIASTGFAALTPKKKIHPPLLGLLIQSDIFINRVIQESIGVAYPAIAETKLGPLHLAYPESLDEQEAIVSYIEMETSTIDQAIARAEREIELMREYRTRLISDVVTGQVDVRSIEVPENVGVDSAEFDESAEDADGFEEAEMSELEEEIEE